MGSKKVIITRNDRDKLTKLIDDIESAGRLDNEKKAFIYDLKVKLNRAEIVSSKDVPPAVVTMNSRFQFMNLKTGKVATSTLVFPEEANIEQMRISIVAPVGIAALGHSEGDVPECRTPYGVTHLKILHVLYQPEYSGFFSA